ncbi:MAG: MarR family transcriptional regulator [Selenomonadaceae bacterium]|nr:MarR family transcriptional regulator [Selenomonadaceae bacterium]
MPKRKFTTMDALLADAIIRNLGRSQSDIARLRGDVSQSTISRGIKDMKKDLEIVVLRAEKHELQQQLRQQKLSTPSENFLSIPPSK